MKKLKIFFVIFSAVLILAGLNSVNAQTTVHVIKGSTHTYTATPTPAGANYIYNWSVSGGTSTSNLGTGVTTNPVLWDGIAGTYTMTVYAQDATTLCSGNNLLLNVVIDDLVFGFTGPTTNVCPKSDNQTGDFTVTASYGGSDAWSYTYNIDGGTPIIVNVAAGALTSDNQIIPGFLNPSATATATHTITVTSFTTSGGTVPFTTEYVVTVTVNPTPTITGITQN